MLCDETRAQLDEQAALADKPAAEVQYAGPWKRLAAGTVDAFLIPVVWYLASFVMGGFRAAASNGDATSDSTATMIRYTAWIVGVAVWWVYCTLMERSANRGTLGKMLLGIAVADGTGNRISMGRAVARNLAKIVSGALLPVNWIMVAFTGKKQGLHDVISGCQVVVKR